MANNGGQIRFGVGFDVDQSSLTKIKSALKEIQNLTVKDIVKVDSNSAEKELEKIKQSANELQSALQRSFNTDLGTLNISKFNSELKKLDLTAIQRNFANAGTVGQKAFKDIATQALTTNMQLKQTNNFLDQISTTMINTVKWSIASSVMNTFTGSVQEAFGYIKALDSSLTDIRIVTGQSGEEMSKFAVQANNAAAALGRQTKEYTQAALTFYQQGLSDADVEQRTEAVLKASNITGESTQQMAEYLTAVWNGFKVSLGEEADVVSKLAAVADSSASDMSELATAMSRVASTANTMGVDVDQLSAQIATIVATTRQAPESVGNALKTIYTRMSDIKTGSDAAEVSLGTYSKRMASLGFNVLDANGKLRDMGEVMEEIGGRWDTLTKEQQVYLAQIMGGQRQVNQITALFDNWNKYVEMLNVSMTAQGTLDQKNAIYMESLAAHVKQLTAAKEGLISSFANGDSFKGIIDGLTVALNLLSKFIETIGGGGTALVALGSIAGNIFGNKLTNSISTFIINLQNAKQNASDLAAQIEILQKFKGLDVEGTQFQELVNMKQQVIDLGKALTLEEQNQANELIKMTNEIQNQQNAWNDAKQKADDYLERVATANKIETLEGSDNLLGIDRFFKGSLSDTTELDKLNEALKVEKSYLQDLQHDLQLTSSELEENVQAVRDDSSAIDNLKGSVQTLHDYMLEGANASRLSTEQLEQLKQAYSNYESVLNSNNASTESVIRAARQFRNAINEAANELQQDAQQAQNAVKQATNNIENELSNKSATIANAWKNLIDVGVLRQQVTQVVNVTSALGQLSSAVLAFKNLGSIWNNNDLTAGEKLLQIMTNAGFIFPMLTSSLQKLGITTKTIGNTFNYLFGQQKLQELQTIANSKANKAEALSLIAKQKALEAEIATKRAATAATAMSTNADELHIAACAAETTAKQAQARAEAAQTAAKIAETKATEAATAAQDAYNASLLANPYVLIGLAIAGVIAGVTMAYEHQIQVLQNATEAVEKFNTAHNELQQNQQKYADVSRGLQENTQEYEYLIKTVGKAGQGFSKLTDAQKTQYQELTDLVTKYNADAITGYDAQGNAILNLNTALDGTIQKLKEKHQEELKSFFGGEEFQEYNKGRNVITQNKKAHIEPTSRTAEASFSGTIDTAQQTIQTFLEQYGTNSKDISKVWDDFSKIQTEGLEKYTENVSTFNNAIDTAINAMPSLTSTAKQELLHLKDVYASVNDVIDTKNNATQEYKDSLILDPNIIIDNIEYNQSQAYQELEAYGEEIGHLSMTSLLQAYAKGVGEANTEENSEKAIQNATEEVDKYAEFLNNAIKNNDIENFAKEFENIKPDETLSDFYERFTQGVQDFTHNTPMAKNEGTAKYMKQLVDSLFGLDDSSDYTGEVRTATSIKLQEYEDVIKKEANILVDSVGKDLQELNFVKNFEDVEQVEKFLSTLNFSQVANLDQYIENISRAALLYDDLGTAISKVVNLNQLADASAQNIVDWSSLSTAYNKVYEALRSGKELTKEQIEQLEALAQKHEELQGIEIAATDAYAEKLREVMDLQDSQGVQNLNKLKEAQLKHIAELRTALEKYKQELSQLEEAGSNDEQLVEIRTKFVAATEELDATIKEYENTEHNIQFIIEADATGEFEESFAIVDKMQDLAAKIPASLKISVDQARDIVKQGFAGMLVDCETTTDGMIRLSEEQMQSYIDDRQAEYQAAIQERKNELAAKIEAQKAVVQAAQDKLTALEQYDAADTTAKKAEAKRAYDTAVANYTSAKQAYEEILIAQAEEKEKEMTNDDTATEHMLENILKREQENIKAEESLAIAAQQACNGALQSYDSLMQKADALGEKNAAAMQALQTGSYSGGGGTGPSSAGGGHVTHTAQVDTAAAAGSGSASLEKALEDNTGAIEDNSDTIAEDDTARQEQIKAAKADLKQQQDTLAKLQLASEALDAASNKIDANQRKVGGGGGGKKGGGNKGKEKAAKEEKEKEPDHMHPFNDEELDSIEGKFHDIDQEIQKLTQDLDKLAKLQDRYLGSALVHNLNQQLAILKKQKAAYKEKLSIAKEELEKQKAKLQAQGVEIGKNGSIANYTDALKKKQQEINGLVDQYNNATAEGQENLKGQVEAQKKNYSELKNQMNAYEQLNGQTIPEIEAQIAQIEEMIIELQIEKFNAVIELHLDWQSFKNSYDDFKRELREFTDQRATMFIDLATGNISGRTDTWEQALDLATTKRTLEKNAERQKRDAQQQYQDLLKQSKSKKGRTAIAQELEALGLSGSSDKKAIQKALADNYEKTIEAIDETRDTMKEKAQAIYTDMLSPSSGTQVELQQALRESFLKANQTAAEARQKALDDYNTNQQLYKKRKQNQSALEEYYGIDLNDKQVKKTFKERMLNTYNDSIEGIEKARKDAIDQAIKDYDEAIAKISDNAVQGQVKVVDVFKTYSDSIKSLAEEVDQMINGTILVDGARSISIVDDLTKHAGLLAERIQRMNENTKIDKQGYKIMGTDQLQVGNIDPLTGDRITNKKQLKQVKKTIGKDRSGQVYADMQKKIYEDGKNIAQELQNNIETLRKKAEEAFDAYYAAIDKVLDYTNSIIDDYEYINDLYDLQIKMAELLSDTESNAADNIREKQKINREAQLKYYQEQITFTRDEMEKAIAREDMKSEAYEKYYNEYKTLIKGFYELQLDYIDELQDAIDDALDDIIEKLNKVITADLGIDELGDRWSQMKEQSDSYLDSVERAFAIQSIRSKYLEAIDETDDLKQQEALRNIMDEQVKALQEAEYLSEAEVTNAENLLEIAKKQMALDEAKQNKTKMRLRRDSQGNYTYQFVADQNDVTSKAQELQDALKKMNEDTTNALEENYDNQVELFKDFISQLKSIKEDYINEDLTDAEYEERLRYAQEAFQQQYSIYQAQQGRLTTNYQNANALSVIGMAGTSNDLDQFMKDMGINSEESEEIRHILESVASEDGEFSLLKLLGDSNIADVIDNMVEGASSILGGIDGVYDLFEALPGDLLNNADITHDQIKDTIERLIEEGRNRKEEIEEAKTTIATTTMDGIDNAVDIVNRDIDVSQSLQRDGIRVLDDLYEQAQKIYNDSLAAMGEMKRTLDKLLSTLQQTAEESGYGSGTGSAGKYKRATFGKQNAEGQLEQDQLTETDMASINKQNFYKYIGDVNSKSGSIVILSNKADKNGNVKIGYYEESTGKTYQLGKIALDKLVGYDSGGYTGDWSGNNGKIAMLHKKEMVLNQDDTTKMLNAVELAKSIADVVSSIGNSAAARMQAITGSVFIPNKDHTAIDQEVTIHATFPNVSNHSEIEEALMNLVNVASQKASPNKRIS